jgi:aldehyde dehydrogenase (NAD+)
MTKYELFIDGRWVADSDQTYLPAVNPFTQEEFAQIPLASQAQVAQAIDAARRAFNGPWGRTTGLQRAKLLLKLADLLEADAERMGTLETTNNGKIFRETRTQQIFAARAYRFFAGYADKLWGKTCPLDEPDVFNFTRRDPVGVVVAITAWNSPMQQVANKLAPAIAAGNCIVIKPSEHASCTTLEFARLIERAGFPPGVVNVVTGDARTGKALFTSGRVDAVSFTGSPAIGREIASAASRMLARSTVELGGKSPNVIFADADIKRATAGALGGIFASSGQSCTAGSRLLVQRPVYHQVVDNLVMRAKGIRMGNPMDDTTEMGPAANKPQFDRIVAAIEEAKRSSAELLTGGSVAQGPHLGRGLFIEPTIFGNVSNDMELAREEIFGPVLSIIPFDEEEEAVAIANDTKYGLVAGVWTKDVSRVLRMSRAISAGTIWVNTYRAVAVQAPFGGVRDSGFGRERGEEALDAYTATKNVMVNFSDEDRDPFVLRT